MRQEQSREYKTRLKQITKVLRKHKVRRGISPIKLRLILEDLGPTFIKLGQIMSMHSDILPKRYCDELTRLRSDVSPMSFYEVENVLNNAYARPWQEIFLSIDSKPLGSASIAQVHKAILKSGQEVVVKVQRPGIYETMERDIHLLHKATRFLPPIGLQDMVDIHMVLDELWNVAKDEMNFYKEASHMEEFARRHKDIVYVGVPKLYHEYTNQYVLVMEYIDGYSIDDKNALEENGYDLNEIGIKLIENYMKQIMDDGFFHADPHSGNVKVRDGQIIWIDMGMMGRLNPRERELLEKVVQGIAIHDIGMIQDAILALGDFIEKPDQSLLYEDIGNLLAKYGSEDMGNIDIVDMFMDLMDVMKENKIAMPHGLTMLARGLTHMEGIISTIAPHLNMIEIASQHMQGHFLDKDWKKELKTATQNVYKSMYKAVNIPSLASDILQGLLKGQTKINLDLHASMELERLLRRLIRNIVMGLWVMALLISSSIICTTNMQPQIFGIPALGAIGYTIAFAIVIYVFLKHIFSKK